MRRSGLLDAAGVAAAVARRPRLWVAAVRQAGRLAAPGWWGRPPFLPLPAPEYLRLRLLTQYGDAEHRPVPADVVGYLGWCRAMGRVGR